MLIRRQFRIKTAPKIKLKGVGVGTRDNAAPAMREADPWLHALRTNRARRTMAASGDASEPALIPALLAATGPPDLPPALATRLDNVPILYFIIF
ncbi:unnamed protein product [Colias eurytheme]|nr:unnamed protein product [Colias eurytheme]